MHNPLGNLYYQRPPIGPRRRTMFVMVMPLLTVTRRGYAPSVVLMPLPDEQRMDTLR